MGKQVGLEIGRSSDSDKCGKCGMDSNDDCCKDEVKVVKADITANFIHSFTQAAKLMIALPGHQQFAENSNVADQHRLYAAIHSPPASAQIPLFIRNCVFRI